MEKLRIADEGPAVEGAAVVGSMHEGQLEALRAENARLTSALAQAERDVERVTRAKDLFVSSVSHELRSPLSTMLMQAQLLRSGDLTQADLVKASEAIERATNRQVQLIEDLLDVVRIVAGKLTLDPQEVSLAAIVRTAVDTQRVAAARKNLELVLAIDPDTGSVRGDYGRLQQVVRNLVSNAIKFSTKGGRIGVSLEARDGQAVLRVEDKGVGIDPAHLPELFTRFTRPDALRPKPSGGLGFGLAVAHTVVERHGGSIRAESAGFGHGATVTVTLPLVDDAAKRETAAP